MYLGKGTDRDYEGKNAAGKLVLVDINQRDEWWINYPVYEAHLKGARALIAVQSGGYGEIGEEALNAQDIAGPEDAPAFSISERDARELKKLLQEKGVDLADHPALQVREYIYDMAAVMRAADLVLCRAGASTISELTALAVPAVIVPSPYVTNNHQEKNARILEKHGGARVILEKDATGEALYRAAGEILRSPELRRSMSAGMAELGIPDATERIYRTVMALRK